MQFLFFVMQLILARIFQIHPEPVLLLFPVHDCITHFHFCKAKAFTFNSFLSSPSPYHLAKRTTCVLKGDMHAGTGLTWFKDKAWLLLYQWASVEWGHFEETPPLLQQTHEIPVRKWCTANISLKKLMVNISHNAWLSFVGYLRQARQF